MARYTTTPWRTPSDLLLVRAQLYPTTTPTTTSTAQQRHAANRILLAWKPRGNLPHAIESTALLIDAQLHHTTATTANLSSSSTPSNFSLRATYTAAFTRFVTGFCDIGRSREANLAPSSMQEIARQIDMPADFVTLRHEATHEELPSLQRLVAATRQALEWLWRVYWVRLGEEPSSQRSLPQHGPAGTLGEVDQINAEAMTKQEEARRLLRSFRTARRAAFKTNTQRTPEHRAQLATIGSACVALCRTAGSSSSSEAAAVETLACVLVEDKYLIPSNHQPGAPITGALALWSDLLLLVIEQQRGFLGALAKQLVLSLSLAAPSSLAQTDGDDNADKDAVFLWLNHLVTWRSALPEPVLEELRVDVMKLCCLYSSHWTQKLGLRLLESGDALFREEWEVLFEASALHASAANDVDMDAGVEVGRGAAILSREPLAMDVDQRETARIVGELEGVGGWRRAALAPHGVPIGVVG
ncbi:hypothetical protein LTR36_000775 [Oleoguttula mirabilis]|uniref:Las1-domain-containing protein n=1 Tax=Oleoguttula mirabilis TaxID=1507867 RepID=A0AAV9J377_9PEZI|nr:hypothetical protein LTR36_000775 [Oleoguttula mirabilis]